MAVVCDLPVELEGRLRATHLDLEGDVREVYLVQLFRRGAVSHAELSQSLGLDRFETDAVLKAHNVTERCIDHGDVDADVASIREFLAADRP